MIKYISLSIGGTPIQAPSELPQPSTDTAQRIIQVGITLFLIVAIILTLFYLIQGGIQWVVSGGDKQQLDQARLKITYAIVGLIIALGGFFIISTVFNFFNLSFK